jgi:hypothetical protein
MAALRRFRSGVPRAKIASSLSRETRAQRGFARVRNINAGNTHSC